MASFSESVSRVGASKLEWTEDYYGEILKKSSDLKTNACCTGSSPALHLRPLLSKIHEDITSSYYGCGLVFPDSIQGTRVLDLGCGTGRDVYLLAQLVGEKGSVVGVDMTKNQLDVAIRHVEYHRAAFGYKKSNVEFHAGFIERLDEIAALAPGSFDVVVSNCVVNLCPDKRKVLQQVYRLLKPGGEMYFSDVYASQRVPADLTEDKEFWGECLSGALYYNDFQRLAIECGFKDPRLVTDSPITIDNARLQARVGGRVDFYSATYRLFKIDELEPDCEDYGQAVIYNGGCAHAPHAFTLDGHHTIQTGKVFPVCGNTYRMLHDTRFHQYFSFIGDWSRHFGLFEGCDKGIPFASAGSGSGNGSCSSSGSCC